MISCYMDGWPIVGEQSLSAAAGVYVSAPPYVAEAALARVQAAIKKRQKFL